MVALVPGLARYFAWTSVSWSISMPFEASFSRAISSSISRGPGGPSSPGLVVLGHVLGGERLVGEAHVHHRGRVALGGRQVDQPPLGEQEDLAPVLEPVALDQRPRLVCRLGQLVEVALVDLDVEVAGVADDRAALHHVEHLAGDRVAVAGHRDEDVALLRRLDPAASRRSRPSRPPARAADRPRRRSRGRRGPWPASRRPCRTSRSRSRPPAGRRSARWWRGSPRRGSTGRCRSGCRRSAWCWRR